MFRCPNCQTEATLRIAESLELPSDGRSDEVRLQICICDRCQLQCIAVYQESRRGGLDSESWEHFGYRMPLERIRALRSAIASCTDPADRSCDCPTHRWLGRRDERGYWMLPEGVAPGSRFPMKR